MHPLMDICNQKRACGIPVKTTDGFRTGIALEPLVGQKIENGGALSWVVRTHETFWFVHEQKDSVWEIDRKAIDQAVFGIHLGPCFRNGLPVDQNAARPQPALGVATAAVSETR